MEEQKKACPPKCWCWLKDTDTKKDCIIYIRHIKENENKKKI